MSVYGNRTLSCPRCGATQTRSVALSLNAERAAEARAAIAERTFQRFSCPGCGETLAAEGPLMYIDFDEKLWIGVFPETWEPGWARWEREPQAAFSRNVLEHSPPVVKSWAPGFRIRAVFGFAALEEKLLCFEGGLDDRPLEALKLDLLRSSPTYLFAPAGRPRLVGLSGLDLILAAPRALRPGEARLPTELRLPRARLDAIARDDGGHWAAVVEALSAGPYVDTGRILIDPAGAEPAEGRP